MLKGIDAHSGHRRSPVSRFLLAVAIFLLIATGMGVPSASAQQPTMRSESLNQLGGTVGKAASNGQYAYIVEGPRVVVLDVSDPRNPRAVGRSPELANRIALMSVVGRYAYVVIETSGRTMTLYVIDVNEPTSPRLIGSLVGIPGFAAAGIAAHSNRVYIAADLGGLRIIDVSIPSLPVEVGSLSDKTTQRVTVGEDTRYVYALDLVPTHFLLPRVDSVQIVDVSNPAMPTRLGALTISSPGGPREFAIGGRKAFVLDGVGNLHVIDFSDPLNPIEIGSYSGVNGIKVQVVGTRAYVLGELLYAFDVTDPARPTLLGTHKLPESSVDLAIVGTQAYVSYRGGLLIVDVENPASPIEIGGFTSLGGAMKVGITNRHAFVVSDSGLRIFDLSNPLLPEMVGSLPFFYYASGSSRVIVAESRAFISYDYSVDIFDVSDLTRPTRIKNYNPSLTSGSQASRIGGVAVVGNDMYLATSTGLHIVDISTPTTPREVSKVSIKTTCYSYQGPCGGIAIVGDRAYVGLDTLHVFDISDRANPREVGRGDTTITDIRDIALSGRYVFAGAYPGLRIFDVADSTRPTEVKFANIGDVASPALRDNHLYVTVNNILQIFDVSDPAKPIQLTTTQQFGGPGLALACGYVYTTNEFSGLRVLQAVPTSGTSLPTPAAGMTRHVFPLLVQRTTLNGC